MNVCVPPMSHFVYSYFQALLIITLIRYKNLKKAFILCLFEGMMPTINEDVVLPFV